LDEYAVSQVVCGGSDSVDLPMGLIAEIDARKDHKVGKDTTPPPNSKNSE
jgi:hypothetical protein